MEKEIYIINEENGQESITDENIWDVSRLSAYSLLLHVLGFDEKNQRIQTHSKETYIISIINQFNRIKSKLVNDEQLFLIAASLGECGNAYLSCLMFTNSFQSSEIDVGCSPVDAKLIPRNTSVKTRVAMACFTNIQCTCGMQVQVAVHPVCAARANVEPSWQFPRDFRFGNANGNAV